MDIGRVKLEAGDARFLSWGGAGLAAHFYGANGYPPAVYRPLVDRLLDSVTAESLLHRAQWADIGRPPRRLRWTALAHDLIEFLDTQRQGPVIGIGHSMGATTTIFAAARRPDLFSSLILVEPAAIPRSWERLGAFIPMAIRRRLLQPGRSTLRRTDRWSDRAVFREKIANWKPLAGLDPAALDAFAAHAVQETPRGVELAYPREWEAHAYFCPPSVWPALQDIQCPVTAIRGAASEFFSDAMWKRWAQRRPDDRIHRLSGCGHLAPLEAPERCAELIRAAIDRQ